MIFVKEGVVFKALRAEIYIILPALEAIFDKVNRQCVITSAADGTHKHDSFHYKNLALDLRSRDLPNEQVKLDVLLSLRDALGENYDVILESLGNPGEHYHLEFDPK